MQGSWAMLWEDRLIQEVLSRQKMSFFFIIPPENNIETLVI